MRVIVHVQQSSVSPPRPQSEQLIIVQIWAEAASQNFVHGADVREEAGGTALRRGPAGCARGQVAPTPE